MVEKTRGFRAWTAEEKLIKISSQENLSQLLHSMKIRQVLLQQRSTTRPEMQRHNVQPSAPEVEHCWWYGPLLQCSQFQRNLQKTEMKSRKSGSLPDLTFLLSTPDTELKYLSTLSTEVEALCLCIIFREKHLL